MRLLVLQGDRESNADNLAQLRDLRRHDPSLSVVLLRRRVAWWQWELGELRALTERVVLDDPTDPRRATRAALQEDARASLGGVLATHDDCLRSAARIAERLELAGCGPETIARCRDKLALHEALARAGVPTPDTALVRTTDEAVRVAERWDTPLVVKPRDMAGSVGVVRVRRREELATALATARAARWPGADHAGEVLLQPFVPGPVVAATAFVERGRFTWLAASDKRTRSVPFFLTSDDRMPATVPEPELSAFVRRATAALGVEHAVVHAEVVAGPEGLQLLELAARPGGGYVAPMTLAHTGVDPKIVAAELALGRRIAAIARPGPAVRACYLFAAGAGRIARIEAPEPPAGMLVRWYKGPADAVGRPPRDFFPQLGFAVASGDDGASAERMLSQWLDRFRAEVRPAGDPRIAAALLRRVVSRPLRRRLVHRLRAGPVRRWR